MLFYIIFILENYFLIFEIYIKKIMYMLNFILGLCVKITDFNISKFGENKKKTLFDQQDTVKMWTYTGTVAFTAPVIIFLFF